MTCFSVIGLKDKILADIQDTGLAHQTFPFLASKMAEYIMKSKSDNTVSKYFTHLNAGNSLLCQKVEPHYQPVQFVLLYI